MGKGIRIEPACPPVAHDHRGRCAAAQRLGLGHEWNVENSERAVRLSALRRPDTQYDGQQHAEGSHVDRAPHHRTAGRPTATALSVDRDDEQDQHQQGDDDHRRRNHDPGLAARERLIDVARLCSKLRQFLSLE